MAATSACEACGCALAKRVAGRCIECGGSIPRRQLGDRELLDAAFRERMGRVGVMSACRCEWPLRVDPDRISGHAAWCPADGLASSRDQVEARERAARAAELEREAAIAAQKRADEGDKKRRVRPKTPDVVLVVDDRAPWDR